MSLYSPTSGHWGEYFLGVEVLEIEAGLQTEEFEAFTDSLIIPRHFDVTGSPVVPKAAEASGQTVVMSRTPDSPREPWAPDHHWHTDRSYWGENQFATVLYAQELEGEVAGTEIIDTSRLLDTIEHDYPGITEVLRPGSTVFSVFKYYAEVLPVKGSAEAIQRTLEQKEAVTLLEVAENEAIKYPPKRFSTVIPHPFRKADALMLDEARAVDIENTQMTPKEAAATMKQLIDTYLALPSEELEGRPYYAKHEWEAGQALILPQIGSMHRAIASPATEVRRTTFRRFIH